MAIDTKLIFTASGLGAAAMTVGTDGTVRRPGFSEQEAVRPGITRTDNRSTKKTKGRTLTTYLFLGHLV